MAKRTTMPPDANITAGPPAPTNGNGDLSALKQRVDRLEGAVATLQDTHELEDRVVERVEDRLAQRPLPLLAPVAPLVIETSRNLPLQVVSSEARTHSESGRSTWRSAWFLYDTYADLRAMLHMYFDPRYRMSWKMRVLPIVILVAIFTSTWWAPGTMIPIVGGIANKLIDLVLAFILIKILTHEARRYRETAPDLPPSLRL
jgi:hypothetical protein